MPAGFRWTAADIPDQSGRVAVVTGANTGIGYETAAALLRRGATVVFACRDVARAADAIARVGEHPGTAEITVVDLADLASVRTAATELTRRHPRIDLLVNNAGVMWTPRTRTVDGFELQFGTNHLGHFALTGLLLETLRTHAEARIVTVSSLAHHTGRIDWDDPHRERRYTRTGAYAQAKLANLLFAFELQRRLAESGSAAISLAAHPGLTVSELGRHVGRPWRPLLRAFSALTNQPTAAGALPVLRAATDPTARGGWYFGPGGPGQARGAPVRVSASPRAADLAAAARLWEESERSTGVHHSFGAAT
ncbi:NAD(P)-dependent dehydrogenase (short-subunit alcohol dehydrogenase family) [Stackebrandtia albiflava]|uniref:NAD(P)-dependent dehydrogenase (Short-subunit alcohol dehydrogenase family) n=1 Tax=Stackebrandtia albiflava TaxID=406432 RepID=A0A562URL2_9ACTN|nr:oxidoreductase [Stackebrandtia albiflava]TWJ08247.1 NAD(P)-dependent dehydrogenase (short-subunit alcohol dehydrogenase family) [Stackebrandtia albiflava]